MKATVLLTAALVVPGLAAPVAETQNKAARQYGSYGDYPPPAGGYGTYGDYAGAGTGAPPPADSAYGSYGDYPPPAGGYGSYGAYKRAVDWVKSIFH